MKAFFAKHKRTVAEIGVVLLALLCIAALWYFIASFKSTYRSGGLRPQSQMRYQQPAPNIIPIASWMTFNYLNVVFKLPPAYLQQQLHITDSRYPNVRIDMYSKREHANTEAVLVSIQKAITSYQTAAH